MSLGLVLIFMRRGDSASCSTFDSCFGIGNVSVGARELGNRAKGEEMKARAVYVAGKSRFYHRLLNSITIHDGIVGDGAIPAQSHPDAKSAATILSFAVLQAFSTQVEILCGYALKCA
jgi:hypothetical protein